MITASFLTVFALMGSGLAGPLKAAAPTGDFKNTMLKGHNWYRGEHNASPVTWNADAAKNAQAWVNKCNYEHQSGNKYGENLAAGGLSSWDQVINMWGGERTKYDYNNPGFSSQTGHFTQMVWKNTKSIGCAWKQCPGSVGTFVACEYSPAGNIVGDNNQHFKDNVQKQTKGKASDKFSS